MGLGSETAFTSLGEVLGVASATEDDLYAAMDWLLPRQEAIEQALAQRHLAEHTLVLYEVTSTYFEGRTCPLARFGHPRDGKKDKLQEAPPTISAATRGAGGGSGHADRGSHR